VPLPFLDTNVLLRHLLQDHANFSPRATAYLSRIEEGQARVRIAETVVVETVFTLEKHYGFGKQAIHDKVRPLIELPGLVLPNKPAISRAFDMYVGFNLSFADAYHAALIERLGLHQIMTFDRQFDRLPGIERIEP